MNVTIHPSKLQGIIQAPASKSCMQRACAAALLSKGKSTIKYPGKSNDDKAALSIIQKLGAVITHVDNETLVIESPYIQDATNIIANEDEMNCGESGLSIRMFTPIAALSKNTITINGSGSLANRPMHFFEEVLPALGVTIQTNEGKIPLTIQGPLQSKDIEIDGSLSSQFLTGLLFAYGALPHAAGSTSIAVRDLQSKPYIDLTLDVMQQFGMNVPENKNYKEFIFYNKTIEPKDTVYKIEADWSGAAFLLVAGTIAGKNMLIQGLNVSSAQADRKIIDVLMDANAGMAIEAKGIRLHGAPLQAFDFDATNCPDLFPPLAVLAAYCKGTSTIQGVHRLTHKESNRAITLKEELGRMGIEIEFKDDAMFIKGGGKITGAQVSSRNDHRIAMACAVAALGATGPTTITDAKAIDKSYPDFYNHLEWLGALIDKPGLDYKTIIAGLDNNS